MFELIDRQPEVIVPESDYIRLLGFPADYTLEGRARDLADWAREWYGRHGHPWICAVDARIDAANDTLRIGDSTMASPQLHDQVIAAQADEAVLAALSAGPECEEEAGRLWQAEKPDEYFFLEVYGSAVVESLVTAARARICGWADRQRKAVLPHYSPGYQGWDIADQTQLCQMIRRRKGGQLAEGLRVLDTGMLQPKKSLLAVFGITRRLDLVQNSAHLIPCESCFLSGCQYRRAPHKDSPPQLESPAGAGFAPKGPPIPSHQGRYSVNPRALRKWSQERLQLKILQDRTVEARFHYEGTTCTNMGRTLDYHYHVRLSSRQEGYIIRDLRCGPAPGDVGHTFMCEYINNREALTRSVANEKPLLGRPLEDVLAWERPFCAAGCHCTAEARQHKWGLALEVILFALAQRGKQA